MREPDVCAHVADVLPFSFHFLTFVSMVCVMHSMHHLVIYRPNDLMISTDREVVLVFFT
jgi:hypothetical protein